MKLLIDGPISATEIADMIQKHQSKTDVGAHAVFMGQIREDAWNDTEVESIEYSAYAEMAEKVIRDIREEAFEQFELRCLHIHHSIGKVKVGELSLFIMVSSAHRKPVYPSLEWIVEQVKKRVPIWKKEWMKDGSFRWIGDKPKTEPEVS